VPDSTRVLGKHFLLGLRPTPDLHPEDRRLLQTLRPAGVIVFRGNFAAGVPYAEWQGRFAALVAEARQAIGRDQVLVCIDHEGGTVLRPPRPITPFGFARRWADRAAAVGAAMGVELASLGVNVNFAPVVDLDSNPANPVIGPRAFASDAAGVIAAAREFLVAQQAQGVLGCLKHFPGHGDTEVDSHLGLPVLHLDRAALAARELQPYAALLGAGVQLIMTAHIAFPCIDADVPATMSRTLIHDVLRGELGYRGAVVTDDLGMRAVSARFDAPGACARALEAGTDLLMVCSHWSSTDRAYAMVQDLERSRGAGELREDTLVAAERRIDALLAASTSHAPRLLDEAVLAHHATLAPLQAAPGAVGQTVSLKEG
jgi:beta-N-acetylhexosaminidase